MATYNSPEHARSASSSSGISWTTQDLNTFALNDPAGLISSATWSTTSSMTPVTGTQGAIDAGRDGIWLAKAVESGITWADYNGILVRMTATEWRAGTGVDTHVLVGYSDTLLQSTGVGSLAGINSSPSATSIRRAATISPGGSLATSSANFSTSSSVTTTVWIPFGSSGPLGAQPTVYLDSSTTAAGRNNTNPVSVSDLNLVISIGNTGSWASAVGITGFTVETALINS
jgi:hypothetical protein